MEENVKVVEDKKFFKKPQIKKVKFKKPDKSFGKGALLGTVVGGVVGFLGRGLIDRAREDDEVDAEYESEVDAEDEDE